MKASTPKRRYLSPTQGQNSIHMNHLDFESYGNSSKSAKSQSKRHGRQGKQEVRTTTADELRKRREKHHKQKEVELEQRAKECKGLQGHFLFVSDTSIPYGHGVGAWRNKLTKLCMALNPAVMDIRWQSEEDMKLLKLRLLESFEYFNKVSDKYIRKLVGNIVTQRCSKLWRRDKGYSGISKKWKVSALPLSPTSSAASFYSNYGDGNSNAQGNKTQAITDFHSKLVNYRCTSPFFLLLQLMKVLGNHR